MFLKQVIDRSLYYRSQLNLFLELFVPKQLRYFFLFSILNELNFDNFFLLIFIHISSPMH